MASGTVLDVQVKIYNKKEKEETIICESGTSSKEDI